MAESKHDSVVVCKHGYCCWSVFLVLSKHCSGRSLYLGALCLLTICSGSANVVPTPFRWTLLLMIRVVFILLVTLTKYFESFALRGHLGHFDVLAPFLPCFLPSNLATRLTRFHKPSLRKHRYFREPTHMCLFPSNRKRNCGVVKSLPTAAFMHYTREARHYRNRVFRTRTTAWTFRAARPFMAKSSTNAAAP